MQPSNHPAAATFVTTNADETDAQVGSTNAQVVARVWAVAIILLMSLNLALFVWNIVGTGDISGFISHQLLTPFLVIGYMLLGVLVTSKRPSNSIGWLFLCTGSLLALSALSAGIRLYGNVLPGWLSFRLNDPAQWLNSWIWIPAQVIPITFVLLLFPNGRLMCSYWRPVVVLVGLGLIMMTLGLALHPGPIEALDALPNPYGIVGAEDILIIIVYSGAALLVFGVIGSVAAVLQRYHRSIGIERQQMKWLAFASIIFLVFLFASGPLSSSDSALAREVGIMTTSLATLGVAVAAAVAVVRYRLYDIEILVNRTLVYGVMTGILLLVYGLIVGGAGVVFQTRSSWPFALLATGLIAVLFQPVHRHLQRGVNRLLYGQRDEPFEVMARLGQRLEQSIAPDSAYPTIVETVAHTLRLPYVAIQTRQGGRLQIVQSFGIPNDDLATYDLTHQGGVVGHLQVCRRSPGEALSPADERLLQSIAQQAGAAVHNSQLTIDLQRSRQQLVTSREEERRRMRRDLHDGLGPSLASLLLEARVLRRMIRDDPAAAEALADEMQRDIRSTIDDIRRVVNELRPPALDDLGLVPALQVMAARLGRGENGSSSELQVSIDAPDDLPPLPAAVEVAAYRIVQEGLTNILHHAHACHAAVCLRVGQDLHVEVRDDGVGFQSRREGGLGLISMRERAAELGGRCEFSSLPEGGVLIKAILPLPEG